MTPNDFRFAVGTRSEIAALGRQMQRERTERQA
jgi:hypothetical protein